MSYEVEACRLLIDLRSVFRLSFPEPVPGSSPGQALSNVEGLNTKECGGVLRYPVGEPVLVPIARVLV